VKQQLVERLGSFKDQINGVPGPGSQPLLSPAQVLRDSAAQHRLNHSVEAYEWFLIYSGQDIMTAILIFFAICPIFFAHFFVKYIYRLLKPKLRIKRKSNFPIIPLKYLQETKEEQRVFLPSKNTLRWVSTRYIIMASDNVVNLKMLHYGEDSEEQRQLKHRKHRAWFMLRILAQFNAIYTRNKLEKDQRKPDLSDTKTKPKLAALVKVRRLQEHEAAMKLAVELEEERREKEAEADAPLEQKQFYQYATDQSGLRKYAYELRHPKDRASMIVNGNRVRKPGSKKRRKSLEVLYEGLRRGMLQPHAQISPEDLRKISTDSLHGEAAPIPERKPPKPKLKQTVSKPQGKDRGKKNKAATPKKRHPPPTKAETEKQKQKSKRNARAKVHPVTTPQDNAQPKNAGKVKKAERKHLQQIVNENPGKETKGRRKDRPAAKDVGESTQNRRAWNDAGAQADNHHRHSHDHGGTHQHQHYRHHQHHHHQHHTYHHVNPDSGRRRSGDNNK